MIDLTDRMSISRFGWNSVSVCTSHSPRRIWGENKAKECLRKIFASPRTLSSSGLYWLMQWVAVRRCDSSEKASNFVSDKNASWRQYWKWSKMPRTQVTHLCLTDEGCLTVINPLEQCRICLNRLTNEGCPTDVNIVVFVFLQNCCLPRVLPCDKTMPANKKAW